MNADTSLDMTVLESLDFTLQCTMRKHGCEHEAKWMLIHQCCGVQWTACEDHKRRYVIEYSMLLSMFKDAKCSCCGGPVEEINPKWVKM